MLEVLRILARRPERLDNGVIFLFNGAEESGLMGSHGFITEHKWGKELTLLINLEAAGSGGKEILFQTGPDTPWLANYYRNVPHPNAQAAGEEIFQMGLIPSDTDFRIFRDYGGLYGTNIKLCIIIINVLILGYDFAFATNGYRYHTEHDDISSTPLESFQHAGDNLLALLLSVDKAQELRQTSNAEYENVVFYDYLGIFMLDYTVTVAIIINSIVMFLSVIIAILGFKSLLGKA